MKTMDKLDYLILSELLKDASLSFVTIAQRVGTSPYTVRRRFEKMKQDGVIHNCVVSIDMSKLGYQGKVFLFVTLAHDGDKSQVITELKKIQNIFVITELVATYDILAIAFITDLKSIQSLVEKAKKIPNLEYLKIACIEDTQFPVDTNFSLMLSQKSSELAATSK
jgi:Lrp/AsnC family transcriptional regulator for asnA, asnC and gidA